MRGHESHNLLAEVVVNQCLRDAAVFVATLIATHDLLFHLQEEKLVSHSNIPSSS